MKTLIIYAHPNTKGHCSTILEELTNNLSSKNVDYEVIDLYNINYDPVLHEDELYSIGNKKITQQNKIFQDKIKDSNLIFIFPNWWNNMPAILKGFIDRVFVSGFAFKYEGHIPKGLLNNKAAVFITIGSPLFIFKFFLGSRAAKTIKKDFLKFCGISSKVFIVDKANKLDEKQIEKIKGKVKKGIDYLYYNGQ